MKKAVVCLWVILFCTATLYPDVITFDDVPGADPQTDWNSVENGYGGLNWNMVLVIHESYANLWEPGSGYSNGLVSGEWVAFNLFAEPATVSSSESFTFNGAYLTAAYNNGLSIDVVGIREGAELFNQTVTVSTVSPTWFDFNFADINEVTFSSHGGTHFLGQGNGLTHFVMDNFTYNEVAPGTTSVPEPGTLALLCTSLVLSWGLLRKRA